MWAAFIRQIAAYGITRRGKKIFALVGVLLLCFATALLVDMQFYISAWFTAALAALSGVAFVVQHFKQKRSERERLRYKAEQASRRALVAQARLDKVDSVKSAVSGAVTGATRAVEVAVYAVANEAVLVVSETAGAVSGAARAVASGSEAIALSGLTVAVKSWRTLSGKDNAANEQS